MAIPSHTPSPSLTFSPLLLPSLRLDGSLFDKLDAVARLVRGARSLPTTHDPSTEPFGGIQLVLCGDFYQLPPVGMEKDRNVRFLFEAAAFRSSSHTAYAHALPPYGAAAWPNNHAHNDWSQRRWH